MLHWKPASLAEMPFRQALLGDPATMAYNAPWAPPDGCLDFPPARWSAWLEKWADHAPERFCAYLFTPQGQAVGEISWHDYGQEIGIVIHAEQRGKGYGLEGLQLLIALAFQYPEIDCLWNSFEATRTPALLTHQKAGFEVVEETDGMLRLRLTREHWLQSKNVR